MGGAAQAPAPSASPVAIRAPDGTIGTVPHDELDAALEGGSEVVSPQELHQAEYEAKYGSALDIAGAGAAGIARGATFGLSDPLALGIAGAVSGPEGREATRQRLSAWEELHPGASLAGEAVGALAPALLSGGATAPESAGAATARAAVRGAAALGSIGERAVVRAATEGAEALGTRVARHAATSALEAGLQGAAFGGGHELSEASLGDQDLTAERVLAGMAKGWFYGAMIGAAGGAGSELVSAGAKGAARLALGAREGEDLSATLERRANEIAWRGAGGTKSMASAAERYGGGVENVAKVWREEAPELVGKRSWGELSREDLPAAATEGLKKYGDKIDASLTRLDESAERTGMRPRVMDVVGDIENQIIKPLEGRANTGAARAKLQNFANDIMRITGVVDETGALAPDAATRTMSFSQLRDFRLDADKVWAGNAIDPQVFGFKADFKRARDLLEQRLLESGEDAAKLAGGTFAEEYARAKAGYQAFKMLDRAAASGVAASGTNRLLSLTDNIVGAGAANVGASIGGAIGGGPGAAIGGVVGGAAGALANKAIRQRFDFVAPDLLTKAAELAGLRQISADVDRRIVRGVAGVLRAPSSSSRVPEREDVFRARGTEQRSQAFTRLAGQIRTIAANPEMLAARVAPLANRGANAAPNIATQVATKASAGIGFLAAHLPPVRTDPFALQQQKQRARPSSADEIDTFEKYLHAWLDPASVLEHMRHGRLPSREAVETLKTQYPRLYERMQSEVTAQLADPATPQLTYSQEIQLSVLFERPTNATTDPGFIRDMQGNFAAGGDEVAQGPGGNPPSSGAPKRPINVASSMQSESQRIQAKE